MGLKISFYFVHITQNVQIDIKLPIGVFLALTGELYELLCHRKEEESEMKGSTLQNECFCNNLDPVHRIQTKFGMDILLDPRNNPAEEFFIFLKIQDGCRRSKICEALYFCGSYKLMGQLYTSYLNDIAICYLQEIFFCLRRAKFILLFHIKFKSSHIISLY